MQNGGDHADQSVVIFGQSTWKTLPKMSILLMVTLLLPFFFVSIPKNCCRILRVPEKVQHRYPKQGRMGGVSKTFGVFQKIHPNLGTEWSLIAKVLLPPPRGKSSLPGLLLPQLLPPMPPIHQLELDFFFKFSFLGPRKTFSGVFHKYLILRVLIGSFEKEVPPIPICLLENQIWNLSVQSASPTRKKSFQEFKKFVSEFQRYTK